MTKKEREARRRLVNTLANCVEEMCHLREPPEPTRDEPQPRKKLKNRTDAVTPEMIYRYWSKLPAHAYVNPKQLVAVTELLTLIRDELQKGRKNKVVLLAEPSFTSHKNKKRLNEEEASECRCWGNGKRAVGIAIIQDDNPFTCAIHEATIERKRVTSVGALGKTLDDINDSERRGFIGPEVRDRLLQSTQERLRLN
jgi:hypothetical protein